MRSANSTLKVGQEERPWYAGAAILWIILFRGLSADTRKWNVLGMRKRGSAMIRSAVAANSARSAGSLISQKPRCTLAKSSATEDAGEPVGPSRECLIDR